MTTAHLAPNIGFSIQPFMSDPQPSRSDPTPEERKGDSSFLPVVVAFVVTIAIIMVAAIVFLKVRQTKAIPTPHDTHPTSQIIQPPIEMTLPPRPTIAA